MADIKTCDQVLSIIKQFGFKDIILEDRTYQIMSKNYFEPKLLGSITLQNIVGFVPWNYVLGSSDCGKFAIRYAGDIYKKFEKTTCNDQGEGPGILVGICKYLRRDGSWHILNGTVINNGDNYHLEFFERTSNGFNWVLLDDSEKENLRYFHAY